MIPVPASDQAARWTNLATGANVAVSSTSSGRAKGLNDRRVFLGQGDNRHWVASTSQSPTSQWVTLVFPVPVTVRTVRLYNLPSGYGIQVNNATVRLYSDAAGNNQVASNSSGALSTSGTNVSFSDVLVRMVRIEFNAVNGNAAGLAEVEVIARAEAP